MSSANVPYATYDEVPWHSKQWFFWLMYFTLTPVALGVLLFSDVYYRSGSEVKVFGLANKIVAGLLAVGWLLRLTGAIGGR